MLEWLKPILGDAYTKEIDSKIAAEIGKGFVARSDFNKVSKAKKKLEDDVAIKDKQLKALSESQSDTDDLKKKIEELRKQNEADKAKYEADMEKIRLDNAVEAALAKAGAKNNTAVKALLVDFLTNAKLADDGTVKGLEAEIENLVKGEDTSFLFEISKETHRQTLIGIQPGNPGNNNLPMGVDGYEARFAEVKEMNPAEKKQIYSEVGFENGSVFLYTSVTGLNSE